MQALVLVGGEGTRLRPLTLTRPKPALPLVDRPFIRYLVEWLSRHGIDEVIMACGFRGEGVRAALGDKLPGGPSISYLEEPEPLGTAGPVRFAADSGLLGERFMVLNGDLLTDLDLTALQRQHAETGAVATIGLHPVHDPSSYGLVRRREDGEVLGFLEKPEPEQIDTDEVNAGAYVLERPVIELIPAGRAVSIEREVFPLLVGHGLYGRRLEGYWTDIGTPERYLQATWDILEGRVETDVVASEPALLIEDGAEVADGAEVGPRAVVRSGGEVGAGARIAESVLLEGCRVGERAVIAGSILGAAVQVGEGATVNEGSVVGDGAVIEGGASVPAGARVQPGEVVGDGAFQSHSDYKAPTA
jgi:mannose-1-phosphate guanylyltransferase